MKKLFLVLTAILLICPKCYANDDNIALLTKKGFFDHAPQQNSFLSPTEEVRKTLYAHLKYANSYNLDKLKTLYADNYINADGFSRDVYFDLIKKTWDSYPDIKYRICIRNIDISGDEAVAQVSEDALAMTKTKSPIVGQNGLLESFSDSVYYLEKVNNRWLIISDHILFEKTFLRYGNARDVQVELNAPCQISADTPYTASLKMDRPKDSLVIASIGQEEITYPQTVAEEVFKKMPEDGVLERMFKTNNKNINEYAVASFGVTKAKLQGTDIKISVTGLGFVMSRVNVIPRNGFVKVTENEKN